MFTLIVALLPVATDLDRITTTTTTTDISKCILVPVTHQKKKS